MDEERQRLLARREIISAILAAVKRSGELIRVLATVREDATGARSAVRASLNVSEVAADVDRELGSRSDD